VIHADGKVEASVFLAPEETVFSAYLTTKSGSLVRFVAFDSTPTLDVFKTELIDPQAITEINFFMGGTPQTQTSKVSGIVQIDGTPADRSVRAFGYNPIAHAIDGETVSQSKSLGQATSDPATGEYTIDLLGGYGKEVFVVAFDDYGDAFTAEQTLAAGDRIHPTTPNGHVWETTGAGTLPVEEPTWIVDTETSQLYGTASMIARLFYRPMVHGPIIPEILNIAPRIFGGDLVYEVDINGTMHRVHEFTANGVAEVVGAPVVELLVVGGGGSGGGYNTGGGGGAGGFLRLSDATLLSGDYTVEVGSGGINPGNGEGINGYDSLAFGYTAIGGGGGGFGAYGVTSPGLDGGSGGGGGGSYNGEDSLGGTGSQGNDGGTGLDTAYTNSRAGGGGGGASGAGGDATVGDRFGGPGQDITFTGTIQTFAGGGSGGTNGNGAIPGGVGGGGLGADDQTKAGDGTDNTGGGGGGSSDSQRVPGKGGSGIVIVAYPI
jgi:hypothetical protein